MPLTNGTRLGPFEILSPLGAGGMGEVYRARDTKLNRDVAVKVLPESLSKDPEALSRFEREAHSVASLNHPNILSIFDFGTHGDTAYAVMELLQGETIRDIMSSGVPPLRRTTGWACQIAAGLAAAHGKGIVHRDLKPDNIFVTNDGRVKILDFGLAKPAMRGRGSSDDTHSPTVPAYTEPGTVMGTVGYMSPEQIKGFDVDQRSDIFSFGAVLYEMLSGKRAFARDTAAETMTAILHDDPPELEETGRHIPSALDHIVHHCLEKNPEQRFQSASDIGFALETMSADTGARSGQVSARPSRRAARALAVAVGLAAAVILGTLIGRVTTPRSGPPRYQRLTFRRGSIGGARFTPDGQSVVYSAAWGEAPGELYVTRVGQPEARPLGIRNADLLSVSRSGEVAVLLSKKDLYYGGVLTGTLARASIEGGVPREVADNVHEADVSPDGSEFSVSRYQNARTVLEFPLGHPVAETGGVGLSPRISPDGGSVAFAFYDSNGHWSIRITDRSGKTRTLAKGFAAADHLCWHPGGREVWFNATDRDGRKGIDAVTLGGRVRTVATGVGLSLRDIAPDGRVLLSSVSNQESILFGRTGKDEKPRDLSWFDGSSVPSLSADGTRMVFTERGDSEGPRGDSFYVRQTDGGPAVRLGVGTANDISADGHWVLAEVPDAEGQHISLVPVEAGTPKAITAGPVRLLASGFFPDGRTIQGPGLDPNGKIHLYVIDSAGGPPRDVSGPGVGGEGVGMYNSNSVASPDGRSIVAGSGGASSLTLFSLDGSRPRDLPGQNQGLVPIQWLSDGRSILLWRFGEFPAQIMLYDFVTGKTRLWKELAPPDRTGFKAITGVCVSFDGSAYAFSYSRVLSQSLYLAEGMR